MEETAHYEPFESKKRRKSKKPVISAAEKALRLLSVRPFGKAELTKRLLDAGYPEFEVKLCVAECEAHGFVNDELLADDTLGLLRSRGQGRRMARFKLRQRGLDKEVIEEAFSREDEEAEYQAGKLAFEEKSRQLRNESDVRLKRMKIMRFMASRGFSSDLFYRLWNESADNSGSTFLADESDI